MESQASLMIQPSWPVPQIVKTLNIFSALMRAEFRNPQSWKHFKLGSEGQIWEEHDLLPSVD